MKSSLRGFVHLALAFAVLMLNLSVVRRAKGASFLTNSPLITARAFHTTTLLPNGKMLVAGGYNDNSGAISGAETYDPSTGVWMTTGALNTARYHHTATLLPNGKVLVTGGTGSNGILSTSELYDPVAGVWMITGALNTGRDLHTATLLYNGQFWLRGRGQHRPDSFQRRNIQPCYGVVVGHDRATQHRTLRTHRDVAARWTGASCRRLWRRWYSFQHRVIQSVPGDLDDDNRLPEHGALRTHGDFASQWAGLVAGGEAAAVTFFPARNFTIPLAGTWTATTGEPKTARENHTASLLPNGQVLIVGGYNYESGYLSSAELYNPTAGTWTETSLLNTAQRIKPRL